MLVIEVMMIPCLHLIIRQQQQQQQKHMKSCFFFPVTNQKINLIYVLRKPNLLKSTLIISLMK